MRYAVFVVGSEILRDASPPEMSLRGDEAVQISTWFVRSGKTDSARLVDDLARPIRLLVAPIAAYRFYLHVHSMKLWSGKRPLILIPDRGLASRICSYAGSWGGGDVVMAGGEDSTPFGPARYELDADGSLKLLAD